MLFRIQMQSSTRCLETCPSTLKNAKVLYALSVLVAGLKGPSSALPHSFLGQFLHCISYVWHCLPNRHLQYLRVVVCRDEASVMLRQSLCAMLFEVHFINFLHRPTNVQRVGLVEKVKNTTRFFFKPFLHVIHSHLQCLGITARGIVVVLHHVDCHHERYASATTPSVCDSDL